MLVVAERALLAEMRPVAEAILLRRRAIRLPAGVRLNQVDKAGEPAAVAGEVGAVPPDRVSVAAKATMPWRGGPCRIPNPISLDTRC